MATDERTDSLEAFSAMLNSPVLAAMAREIERLKARVAELEHAADREETYRREQNERN